MSSPLAWIPVDRCHVTVGKLVGSSPSEGERLGEPSYQEVCRKPHLRHLGLTHEKGNLSKPDPLHLRPIIVCALETGIRSKACRIEKMVPKAEFESTLVSPSPHSQGNGGL